MEVVLPHSCAKDAASHAALMSHIMKTLEKLVLEQLRPMVRPFTDPLQFAYQPRLGVEGGIIYLLNRVYTHLDKPASTARVVFF